MEDHFRDPSDPNLVSGLPQETSRGFLQWDQGPVLQQSLFRWDIGNTQQNIREGIVFNHVICNKNRNC